MWKRLSQWMRHISNTWVTLSALLIFLLFSALILPAQPSPIIGLPHQPKPV